MRMHRCSCIRISRGPASRPSSKESAYCPGHGRALCYFLHRFEEYKKVIYTWPVRAWLLNTDSGYRCNQLATARNATTFQGKLHNSRRTFVYKFLAAQDLRMFFHNRDVSLEWSYSMGFRALGLKGTSYFPYTKERLRIGYALFIDPP